MKSYVLFLQGVYRSLCEEIAVQYPFLQLDSRRDSSRLLSNIECRGLPFAMVDLPAFAKHLDQCVANGRLTASGLPGFRVTKRGGSIPHLFKGLILRIFDDSGVLRSNSDITAFRAIRQLCLVAKKLKMECSDDAKYAVLSNFFTVDSGIEHRPEWDYDRPDWRHNFSHFREVCGVRQGRPDLFGNSSKLDEDSMPPTANDALYTSIQKCMDIVSSSIGVFNPNMWQAKHGPGAVSDQRFGFSKYEFPTWSDKLERIFPKADFAFANYGLWADAVNSQQLDGRFVNHESPSKLCLVPKTLKAPRLIAAEPISHQWCQQVVKDFFYERVKATFLSKFVRFSDQTQNGKMALVGSISGDLCTIDLSEASDRVSLGMVECLFRNNLSVLDALHASRTRWVRNPYHSDLPSFHKLRKFACMGSACTFPIQTLLFLSIGLGCLCFTRGITPSIKNIRSLSGSISVFGDDIVVSSDSAGLVVETLTLAGLKINTSKTFLVGKFRESCGIDAYGGVDVTPVYVLSVPTRSRPESVISSVMTANNAYTRGWTKLHEYIDSAVRKVYSRIPYIDADSGAFGVYDLYARGNHHLRRRWNPRLQRIEYLSTHPIGRVYKKDDRGDSSLLQYFTEAPRPTDLWAAGYQTKRSTTSLRSRWVTLG